MTDEQIRMIDLGLSIFAAIGIPTIMFFLHKIDIEGRNRLKDQSEIYDKTIRLLQTSNLDINNDFQRVKNDLQDLRLQMEQERGQYQLAIRSLNEQLKKVEEKYEVLSTEHKSNEAIIHQQRVYILRLQSYLKMSGMTEEQVIEITNGVNPNKEISK